MSDVQHDTWRQINSFLINNLISMYIYILYIYILYIIHKIYYIYIYVCVCVCVCVCVYNYKRRLVDTSYDSYISGGSGGRILIQTYSSSSLWKYASNIMNYQLYSKCQWDIFTCKGNGLVRMLRRKVKLTRKRLAKLNEMGRKENNGGGHYRRSRSSFYENN